MIRRASHADLEFLIDGLQRLVEHIRVTSQDAYFIDLETEYQSGFGPWLEWHYVPYRIAARKHL